MLGDLARADERVHAGEANTARAFHAPEGVGAPGKNGRSRNEGLEHSDKNGSKSSLRFDDCSEE